MPTVRANGIDIAYEETGTGEPLLLIMGLGGQLVDWPQPMVDALVDAGFRVIRHDNRDIGLSEGFDWTPPSLSRQAWSLITKRPVKDVGYTLADMADDAAALLEVLSIESAHIVGASMGGMIAQSLAIHHPARVRSLCSIMSNTGDRRSGGVAPKVLTKLLRAEVPSREDAPRYFTDQYRHFAGSAWDSEVHFERAKVAIDRSYRPGGTARQAAAISGSPDRTAALGDVSAPTLVIHGLEDTLVRPSGGIATVEAVPNARLLMLPDMGHDFPAHRIGEMVAAIKANTERAVVASRELAVS